VLQSDETQDVVYRNPALGYGGLVLWTTQGFPVDNSGDEDGARRPAGITVDNGTVFRIVEFQPGNQARVHRTDSLDYALVLRGQIDMELDDGASVHLEAGDVLVQRGTIHNWLNRGTEPCAIAFILVAARPVAVDGAVLGAEG
jgi:quercetin dioxygenase-like cupin family protein